MLEITERAATLIAEACNVQELPEAGGLRISRKSADHHDEAVSLVVAFVDRPQASDTALQAGPATVLLAEGVERLVATRVLDVKRSGLPPSLVLRSHKASTADA